MLPPSANNPRLLVRMIAHVSEGIRSKNVLAELLNCQVGTVSSYLQAARWLGLLEPSVPEKPGAPVRLSRLGLALAFGDRQQWRVYADAVWSQPFVREIMSGRGDEIPSLETLVRHVLKRHPEISPATACRRASAIRGLLEPAVRLAPRSSGVSRGSQLPLGFPIPRPPATQDRLRVEPGPDPNNEDPAVYRVVLQSLLDYGEMGVNHLRGILDKAGATTAPVGTYTNMLLRRGDASRLQEGELDKLVVTPGAIARRSVSDTVASVALSDPEYREYLDALIRADRGDPAGAMIYGKMINRFGPWDRRLFGGNLKPREVARAVERMLMGSPLAAFPMAGPAERTEQETEHPRHQGAPFLDLVHRSDLFVALPPSLDVLVGGISVVNQLLLTRSRGPLRVGEPTAIEPRILVHGGLLHPGERPPRAFPDNVEMRLRLVSRVPHVTCLLAMLLLHRGTSGNLTLRFQRHRLRILYRRRNRGTFLDIVDRLMAARGWRVSRRFRGGMTSAALVSIVEALGMASVIRQKLILDENFFLRLKGEPEDRQVFDKIMGFVGTLETDLNHLIREEPDSQGISGDDEPSRDDRDGQDPGSRSP